MSVELDTAAVLGSMFDGVKVTFMPGAHNVPADEYHAEHDCLTQSGAKKLLPPSCPAKFRWWRDHPEPPKAEYELGTAAHRMVLGKGAELSAVPEHNWRTKRAQDAANVARLQGKIPMLMPELGQVTEMVAALHRQVPGLFNSSGHVEQTLVWDDADTGVRCKAMLDWWRPDNGAGRAIVTDYKTCAEADDESVGRAVARYGYHQQAAWYADAVEAVTGMRPRVCFVFQEKTEPYLVNIVQIDERGLEIGAERNALARQIYRDCVQSGLWPGYNADRIGTISLPRWAVVQHLNMEV